MATLTVRLDSPIPITEQIVSGLRRAIAIGELQPHDELPPVRQLAADLGVNLNTVARAYRTLEASGLLSTVRGRGTRITSSTEKKTATRSASTLQVKERITNAVVDAKLAGMSHDAMNKVFQDVLASFFKPT
jgi:GntR family transcriptional regulator